MSGRGVAKARPVMSKRVSPRLKQTIHERMESMNNNLAAFKDVAGIKVLRDFQHAVYIGTYSGTKYASTFGNGKKMLLNGNDDQDYVEINGTVANGDGAHEKVVSQHLTKALLRSCARPLWSRENRMLTENPGNCFLFCYCCKMVIKKKDWDTLLDIILDEKNFELQLYKYCEENLLL